jgi:glutaredoxin
MKTHTVITLLAAGLWLALGAGSLQAQTLYRNVGPDGRVSFSDVPPPGGPAKAAPGGPGGAPASATSPLPYELQQVASRYPVTLYTAEACAPCASGRNLLNGRGIPFTERTVSTPDDAAALQRLSGDNSLPLLTVGGQQIKGFSDLEWGQFLDAAGYPKTSQLPANYRAPPATPLVAVQRPAPAAAPGAAPSTIPGETVVETYRSRQRPAQEPPPEPEPDTNPAGIRF